MTAAIYAGLLQQFLWEEKESILYNYLVNQLDDYGLCPFNFGDPLF